MRVRLAVLAAIAIAGAATPWAPVRLATALFALAGTSLLLVMSYLGRRPGLLALKAVGLLGPLVLPHLIWRDLPLCGPFTLASCGGFLAAAGLSAALLLAQRRQVRVALDRDIAHLMGPLPRDQRRFLWAYWASAPIEELFFRGYIVTTCAAAVGWWAAPLGAALFTVYHYLHPRSAERFGALTYVAHFCGGLGWGAVLLWTGALWPCMAAHLVYNLPFYVMLGRRAARGGRLDAA